MKNLVKKIIYKFFKDKHWQDMEYFDPKWSERIYEMSKFLKDGKSVVDLGCGKMWLKQHLSNNAYFPVDYADRGPGTIICDFNKQEFPNINTDVAFVSGTLEYVADTNWFVSAISTHSDECILSYCTIENFADLKFRRKQAWLNDFSRQDILNLFSSFGFNLVSENITQTKNSIFYFIKNQPSDSN